VVRNLIVLAVINGASLAAKAAFELKGWTHSRRLHSYRVSEAERDRPDLTIDPQGEFALSPGTARFADTLPPASVTVYTTYRRAHGDPGVIAEQ